MLKDEIDKIWEAYLKDRSKTMLKEKILMHYVPLVRIIAGRMMISLPSSVSLDDLVSNGLIGLINAIDRFEVEKCVKFETFANIKIKGAILDGLRELDWVPRNIREKSNILENAIRSAEGRLNRLPTDSEIAEELQIPLENYFDLLNEVKSVALLSLDSELETTEGTQRLLDIIEDKEAKKPDEIVERQELKNILVEAIMQLKDVEKNVIALYYYEQLTLKEIGEVLTLTESRVCQIHTKVIVTLRNKISDYLHFK